MALIDLHLIRHDPATEALVKSVLKVPARLRLLNKLANSLFLSPGPLGGMLHNSPDFEVFYRVTGLVFRRPLPCDDVSAQGREAKLIDVLGGEG